MASDVCALHSRSACLFRHLRIFSGCDAFCWHMCILLGKEVKDYVQHKRILQALGSGWVRWLDSGSVNNQLQRQMVSQRWQFSQFG